MFSRPADAQTLALRCPQQTRTLAVAGGRAEKNFQRWEANYQSYIFNWATCSLLRQIGNPEVHPDVQAIMNLHDQSTRAEAKLPLA